MIGGVTVWVLLFVLAAWREVAQQLEEGPSPGPRWSQGAVLYQESGETGPHMDSEYRLLLIFVHVTYTHLTAPDELCV